MPGLENEAGCEFAYAEWDAPECQRTVHLYSSDARECLDTEGMDRTVAETLTCQWSIPAYKKMSEVVPIARRQGFGANFLTCLGSLQEGISD